jgi:hypothetical protein
MKKTVCLVLALGLSAALALADGPAVRDFSGGTEYESYYGSTVYGDVVGWDFTPQKAIVVTHLGYYTDPNHGGLEQPKDVGIWDTATQALLLKDTVSNADPITGKFHYHPVKHLALTMGTTYTIGGLDFSGDNDWYVSGASSVTWDPDITFVQNRYPDTGELGFVFPTKGTTTLGRFGPDFMFIPEPASLLLFGLAALLRRR